MSQPTIKEVCLCLGEFTTIRFPYKNKTYEISIRKPEIDKEAPNEPVRLEPKSRVHGPDGIMVTSLHATFEGENGDQRLAGISLKVLRVEKRVELDVSKVHVLIKDTGETVQLVAYLRKLQEGMVSKN